MKKIIWGFFCALLLAAGISAQAEEAEGRGAERQTEELTLYAMSAALLDADTGRVLYGKNADTPMAMASTTKIMTCIVVLENVSPEETLTVSAYAASMPKVKLYIKQGEEYTVGDLLYSLMLESHNDSAVALAEYVGKRLLPAELAEKPTEQFTAEESRQAVAAFAGLMNKKAAEIGCTDSWFITPNGLDATQEFTLEDGTVIQKEHCTTAAELARIMAYCIRESPERERFLEITGKEAYAFGYVGSLERDGRTFVVALLACGWPNNKSYKWSDTRELMQYGIENYFFRSFSEEGVAFDENLLRRITVLNGQTELLGGVAGTEVKLVGIAQEEGGPADCRREGLLLRADEEITVEYSQEKVLTAPVEAGRKVGEVLYSVDGTVYKRQSIVTVSEVRRIDLRWCLEQVMDRFLILPLPEARLFQTERPGTEQ